MNVEYFIAKRLFTAKEKNNTHTQPILRIAILAIALSVAVMLLSLTVLTGFKNEITSKIIGFGSHITIANFTDNQSYESDSISIQQDFYPSITKQDGIKHISVFASKAGIVKTKDEILGVVLKGVAADYDWSFFQKNLIAGKVFSLTDSVVAESIEEALALAQAKNPSVSVEEIITATQATLRSRKYSEEFISAYINLIQKKPNVGEDYSDILRLLEESLMNASHKGLKFYFPKINKSNSILISESISKTLKLGVDDDLVMYFAQDPPRVRKFKITGIYNTALAEFDKLFILGDIQHIQALNSWENNEVGGFEITIDNFEELDKITANIYEKIPYNLNAQSIKEKTPQLFDWLDLQDMNVRVILILMLIVGGINMITALLILILERTRLIGILKALGARNWSIRRVFLYSAVHLILKGLLLGNAIGLGFSFLQQKFSLISLDPATYYMDTVPIYFNFTHILLLNICTIIVCYLILIIPSIIITKITPIKAIRFE